jgi:hypothetical protein
MPGLAASTAILKEYNFRSYFEVHLLEWDSRANESLARYAKELPKNKTKSSSDRSFIWWYSGSRNGKTY